VNAALSRGTIVRRLWLLLVAAACSASSVQAHEVRPAYLEIRETSSGTFDVLWKVPARGEYRLSLHVRLPGECRGAPLHGSFVGGAFIEQWQASCPNGLVGGTIAIDGLSATRTDVLARLERVDGTTQTVRLTPEQTSFVVAAAPTALEVSGTYFMLGVEHILLGIDHLLFVLGLLFLVGNWKQLVGTVTAFTVAHSITLAGATLGWLYAPQAPIEATIALSVMFVAAEILRRAQGPPRPCGARALAGRVRVRPAARIRLLGRASRGGPAGAGHSACAAVLQRRRGGRAVGVHRRRGAGALGRITRLLRRPGHAERGPWHSEAMIRVPVAYAIGSIAAFWTVQRVVGFWP
jgi:hypothetical protein